jgi:hypothetical protein
VFISEEILRIMKNKTVPDFWLELYMCLDLNVKWWPVEKFNNFSHNVSSTPRHERGSNSQLLLW